MKNSRLANNPVNQNKHIYKCITVNFECGWNIPCDYYINRTSYKPDIKYFSTKKSKWKAQVGIQIIDENARSVFDRMDMTDYIFRGISSYSIDHSAIHKAFNEKMLELEWRELLESVIVQEWPSVNIVNR